MDATLHALGQILVKAAPTFLLVLFLHFYLKWMFFKPLAAVLKDRYDATQGARKAAEESLERAASKAAEYENAVRAARTDIYQSQDRKYRDLQDSMDAQLAAARARNGERIKREREEIARDAAEAKRTLESESEAMAAQIAEAILRRSAA